MSALVHAVMCGGSGTRLWPWSRKSYPKQFLSLFGERSLLQATVDRLAGFPTEAVTVAFGNEEHRFLIAEQLGGKRMGYREIVLEPAGRNTAPVAVIAALKALDLAGAETVVLLSPADHHIADAAAYRAAIERAMPAARSGRVVALGVAPDHPSTAFGYMLPGAALDGLEGFHAISRFTEKPDAKTAQAFLAEGDALWNSGIFLFQPETLLAIVSGCRPELVERCRDAYAKGIRDGDFFRVDAAAFSEIAAESFDRAIMETIGDVGAVTRLSAGWTDVGSWDAMRSAASPGLAGGNSRRGPVEMFGCSDVLGLSDGPLVVAHGLKNTIIAADHDAVYVAAAGAGQQLSGIVQELERRGRTQASTHMKIFRPWGWYRRINVGEGFEVREIMVKPGGQLSLQMHKHRAEHWVVVRGTARVTVGDEVRLLAANESVYVPAATKHRLENPGDSPMHVIEVQSGSILAEDDIIRFEDRYGRAPGRQPR